MSGMKLAEFLLARITEDEADARLAQGSGSGKWTQDGGSIYAEYPVNEVVDYVYDDGSAHIGRWDPARVLVECEAKRRIVTEVEAVRRIIPAHVQGDGDEHEVVIVEWAEATVLRLLALPYADHPDFDEDWS